MDNFQFHIQNKSALFVLGAMSLLIPAKDLSSSNFNGFVPSTCNKQTEATSTDWFSKQCFHVVHVLFPVSWRLTGQINSTEGICDMRKSVYHMTFTLPLNSSCTKYQHAWCQEWANVLQHIPDRSRAVLHHIRSLPSALQLHTVQHTGTKRERWTRVTESVGIKLIKLKLNRTISTLRSCNSTVRKYAFQVHLAKNDTILYKINGFLTS